MQTVRLRTKERTIYYKLHDYEEFTKQSKVWFPKKSSRGKQYVMVMAGSNSNAILVEPMKNRTSREMIRAYQVLIDQFNAAGIFPTEHILDNGKLAEFLEVIKKNKMTY